MAHWQSAADYAWELDRRLEDLAEQTRRAPGAKTDAELNQARWRAAGLEFAREILREVLHEPPAVPSPAGKDPSTPAEAARQTPTSIRCGVPWPVCPRCLGEGLHGSAGRWRCPRCGGEWAEAERVPCPDPGKVALADEGGGGQVRLVCASHAAHPSAARLRKALRLAEPDEELPPTDGKDLP